MLKTLLGPLSALGALFGRSLSDADPLGEALPADAFGEALPADAENLRTVQDFGLLTDLSIKPTAVDVAMLKTLLGPLSALGALFGRSLSDASALGEALHADAFGEALPADAENLRTVQDFGLLTDLSIKPTAVDVAMLQTLLGPLSALGALFGRSLSDASALGEALPADTEKSSAPF
ncbi:MAG: hypothetical protein KVP17_000853 [Porospora cf. gigantea B]|uniref:uncharacterized protein n=1 Tax=Porospora cf. gigantea B TaxID=2853592 RepID=UPI003571C855|nr:MAG: hypothetical protein KVP17_000853 [Porospora cf. gigantea B]